MYNILVTGVGAIIGYGIICSLKKSRYDVNIIGIDIYADAVGQEWCDKFIQGLPAKDERFPEYLGNVVKDNNIDLVITGIEQDLTRIVEDFEYFDKLETKFAINDPGLIKILNDKWLAHQYFLGSEIDLIPTFTEQSFQEIKKETGLPMLLKPRRSYASKGIQKIYDEADFYYWKNKLTDDFMVQKIMGDGNAEFTVSIFGIGDGGYTNLIALKRKLGPDGATAKAEVVFDSEIDQYVDKIAKYCKPKGPTNIQIIKDNDRLFLLEINPRISASTSIRQLFGVNEAEMCVEFYIENKIPEKKIIKQGKVRRYIKDFVTYDSHHI